MKRLYDPYSGALTADGIELSVKVDAFILEVTRQCHDAGYRLADVDHLLKSAIQGVGRKPTAIEPESDMERARR